MIDVVGVTHHYGYKPVLRDITFNVPTGQLVALMGPNGMGKSTLLGVMAGVLCPLVGHIEIGGMRRRRTPAEELAIRKQVVYLPDQPWLPAAHTGREYLLAVGELYEVPTGRLLDHCEGLFDLFHLDKHADSPIGNYSQGQKKKLAVAGALVTEAPVMLLDEPFSGGLDASGLLAAKRVFKRLADRDDVTVVLATPVPEIVEEIAERILVLRDGAVAAYGTADDLRRETRVSGPLEEVLESLLNPQTTDRIERYLEGR